MFFTNYFYIISFCILSILIVLILYVISRIFSNLVIETTVEKISTYECGFIPFDESHLKFDINFYIVSLLFVVFDLELVFLFPWSVVLNQLELVSFFVITIFFIILTIGFIFEWRSGALDIS
jgi:NADH:ubiquinone oxidoreductase subunit 3 (subunit A)